MPPGVHQRHCVRMPHGAVLPGWRSPLHALSRGRLWSDRCHDACRVQRAMCRGSVRCDPWVDGAVVHRQLQCRVRLPSSVQDTHRGHVPSWFLQCGRRCDVFQVCVCVWLDFPTCTCTNTSLPLSHPCLHPPLPCPLAVVTLESTPRTWLGRPPAPWIAPRGPFAPWGRDCRSPVRAGALATSLVCRRIDAVACAQGEHTAKAARWSPLFAHLGCLGALRGPSQVLARACV